MEIFKEIVCRYFFPALMIILAAPIDIFMPWFVESQGQHYYSEWTPEMKKRQNKTPMQERAGFKSAIIGIVTLAVVWTISYFSSLPDKTVNIICLSLGAAAFVLWLVWDNIDKKKRDKYR